MVLVAVLGMLTSTACCREPRFPMIWASPELEAGEVIKAFGSRTPALHRTDSMADLLAEEQVRGHLESTGLDALARRVAPDAAVEMLVYEGACGGEDRQLVVAVFDGGTGRIVTVDDKQILFVRVAVSQHS